ncbi:hypothetical protein HMPREF9374_1212 [Desmospora sp. 8437]|nr:hypothetical protein HMPREF9374_1212 [Desmospora sp. 8437]
MLHFKMGRYIRCILEKKKWEEKTLSIFYTVHTKEAWIQFQKAGYLTGSREHVRDELLEAYHWMMKQMAKRLPRYEGEYPIWLYTQFPDHYRYTMEKGLECVLLAVELREEDVLISDFETWHCVLNQWYLLWEDEDEDHPPLSMEESWERIFELERLQSDPMWKSSDPMYQGVTGKIPVKQVKSVTDFIAEEEEDNE